MAEHALSTDAPSKEAPLFIVMAGGTGGHIFPALAVADELKKQGFRIHWLGTRDGMEADLVPKYGYDITFMPVKGVRGNGLKALVQAPFRVALSLWHAVRVMKREKAVAVLGMGGFVSGPGSVAAWLLRKPLVLHEQNAVLGLTNKIASLFATKKLEAFPGAFPAKDKAICTGNPVREMIVPASDRNTDGALRLLVLGGSRGAVAINEIVPKALARLNGQGDKPVVEVRHQTGAANHEATQKNYEQLGVTGRVDPFIDDMAAAYGWADLVLCRSGALTVAELANAGKPAVLVPYPWHKDQQQLKNGRYLADNGAAVILEQKAMTEDSLCELLLSFANDRQKLVDMANKAQACAHPNATQTVAKYCREVAHV
ncbi:undecaprenyldiphospho-muramoylpentapeptide beta-N-acetylglucosaminyltransferase [Parendozoicomonas haliclonae]|uniref:UDP-N-acetylglucosamine--N-acetylmuramyl-(pentapeptide) pyrophosphoryl-undecaprenol N-acetylglucosamine transferase n=1 Tax=Parendozoicomonas haliclonae TaxID=1960125 RepID=A0A1X7AEW6_9GAMM|nr:undecaprenyldiphospho-muramoylpentapeptide beta-N-acetylglucosaminyltransferase [Parendozoicomonas haliclonae]SMA34228.1 UDP-N-acetylglucosamine-N-acetylmuramyl-(pentapeptide) pyrophosphoryl-undecaprenol N-acetylglucosamine transferase [Parendozoicomonas haliclonae]